MRNIITKSLFSVFFIFLISCKKDNTNDVTGNQGETDASVSIVNNWELRFSYGGFREPGRQPYYLPGNGYIWKFTNTNYQLYSAGQVVNSGGYTMTKDTCTATGTLMDAIVINWGQGYTDKIFIQIAKDTLTMYRGIIAADGTIDKYVRLKTTAK